MRTFSREIGNLTWEIATSKVFPEKSLDTRAARSNGVLFRLSSCREIGRNPGLLSRERKTEREPARIWNIMENRDDYRNAMIIGILIPKLNSRSASKGIAGSSVAVDYSGVTGITEFDTSF